MKISLNNLLDTSICSYRWPLDLSEYFYESAKNDLRECSDRNYETNNNFITVETGDKTEKVNIKDIDCDWEYIPWYEKLECETLVGRFDDEKLTKALAKYWIKKIWYDIRKPQFYNFEQDSLDLEYEYEGGDWRKQYPDLIPYVQQYINEIRQPSRDGYISFEPNIVEKVDKDDSAYIWAILKKENLLDELKSDLEMWIEDVVCNDYELINWFEYEYNGRKHQLDYDWKKLFIP